MSDNSLYASDAMAEDPQLTPVMVNLLKGILYRDSHPNIWFGLEKLEPLVRDQLEILGLTLLIDESEGYAFVRQKIAQHDGPEIPRLIQRRSLSYPVSLLCVLLRKRLAESDHSGEDVKVVISRDEIVNLLQVFLPDSANEAKILDQIDIHIRKVTDLGFLKKLKEQDHYEIRRILKSLVDADWLTDLNAKLEAYKAHAIAIL